MSAGLGIIMINAWNKVALELDLLVEFVLAVAETGSLFEAIPFLGALSVTVGPPLRLSSGLCLAGGTDLRSSCKSIRVRRWLGILMINTWNKSTLQFDLTVELFLTIAKASSLFKTVPLLGTLTIAVRPP